MPFGIARQRCGPFVEGPQRNGRVSEGLAGPGRRGPTLRTQLAAIALLLATVLAGCIPVIISSGHGWVLVVARGDTLVRVPDEDPLYGAFEREVLGDPYVARMLSAYAHTTEVFIASSRLTHVPQTVANHPVIVLDSLSPGPMHDIIVLDGERTVHIELALGLGREGEINLEAARRDLPWAIAPLLLELVGLRPEPSSSAWSPDLGEPDSEARAFWLGFQAALGVRHLAEQPDLLAALRAAPPSPEASARLEALERVPTNGYRFEGESPTSRLRPREEALRTPGVAAAFLYRLLDETSAGYPQRDMLWFVQYASEEIPLAKALLAVSRMGDRRAPSVATFLRSYAESFPAERDALQALEQAVFGKE